jgi:membrane associated rhomboid family serine protease
MQSNDGMTFGFVRPGRALIGLMIVITTVWLMFAIGLNWGGASSSVFLLFTGSTDAILHGEVWRLFTAPLLHTPRGENSVGHLLWALLGLLFFATRLEDMWGGARLLRFIALSCVLAYLMQMAVELVLPAGLAARLVGSYWYGLQPAIAAVTIAWACSFKGQTVNLFLLPPMSSRTLILVVVGFGLLRLAAAQNPEEGLLAPFCGMFLGWALGGGTPSPLRKAWLKLRLARLEGQDARRAGKGARRVARPNPSGLRVIPGGRSEDEDDKGPDGRWLN